MPCRLRSRVKLRVRLHHGDGRARCFRGSGALETPMIPALNNRFSAAAAALTRLQGMLRQPQTDAGLYHARPARAGAPPALRRCARQNHTTPQMCRRRRPVMSMCSARQAGGAESAEKRRANVAKNRAKVAQASRNGMSSPRDKCRRHIAPAKSENRHAVLTFSIRINLAGADSKRKKGLRLST